MSAPLGNLPSYGYGQPNGLVPAYGYGAGVDLLEAVKEIEVECLIRSVVTLDSSVHETELVELESPITPVVNLFSEIVNPHLVNAEGSFLSNPTDKARISVKDVGVALRVNTGLNFDDNPLSSHEILVKDCFGVEHVLTSTIFNSECGILEHIVEANDFVVEGQYVVTAKVVTTDGRTFYGEADELEVYDEFQLQFP